MATSIPAIDVDGADLASPRVSEIARAIDDAFRRTGFCYVTNAGIEAKARLPATHLYGNMVI